MQHTITSLLSYTYTYMIYNAHIQVIDVAYLVVIICLIIPHFTGFRGNNTVSSSFICNTDEESLSLGNPTRGTNILCSCFGILIFSGFKIILIYTGMLCVNIWYRLWKPLTDAGLRKRYLHGFAFILVFVYDIFIIGFGGIEANPSNGVCYVANNTVLLLMLDIIPNILFIIISALCVAHAAKSLKRELNVIQQADLVTDDLINLIHRMLAFLFIAIASSAIVVLTEIVWWICSVLWEESTNEWIHCAQVRTISEGKWRKGIGNKCIDELKKEGYSFPNEIFFIAFPIAALLRFVFIKIESEFKIIVVVMILLFIFISFVNCHSFVMFFLSQYHLHRFLQLR